MNTLVAITPTDMAPASKSLLEYISEKMATLAAEFTEASKDLLYAKSHKWRTKPLEAVVSKIARRQTFYEKLKAAVEAGYIIMPSLQMTLLAIRTKAKAPRETSNNGTWNGFEQQAQTLSVGAGEYRNPTPTQDSYTEEYKNSKGEAATKEVAFPVAFEDEFSMPVELCKPLLLARTEAAMALKVFDEIGVVRDNATWNRRGDPIIVGTVVDPTRRGRRFSFFIAWALPIDDL